MGSVTRTWPHVMDTRKDTTFKILLTPHATTDNDKQKTMGKFLYQQNHARVNSRPQRDTYTRFQDQDTESGHDLLNNLRARDLSTTDWDRLETSHDRCSATLAEDGRDDACKAGKSIRLYGR